MKSITLLAFGALMMVAGSSYANLRYNTTEKYTQNFQDSTQKVKNRQQQSSYRDLSTGQALDIRYDKGKRLSYNNATGKQVDFYVNSGGDTLSGSGRHVVNSYLLKGQDGTFSLDTTRVRVGNDGIYSRQSNQLLKTEKVGGYKNRNSGGNSGSGNGGTNKRDSL